MSFIPHAETAQPGTAVPQKPGGRRSRAGHGQPRVPAACGPAPLDPNLATRFALMLELTERTRTACSRALAAMQSHRAASGLADFRNSEVRRAIADLNSLRPLRETALAVAAQTRRQRPSRTPTRPAPLPPHRDDPRRAHHGFLSDEVILAPVIRGLSYRRAAAELSDWFGRPVTKRQVEEAVNRAGGLRALRLRS